MILADQAYNCGYILRGKKITCPGAWHELNFRQDKHIFSPNVQRASEKISALQGYFSLNARCF